MAWHRAVRRNRWRDMPLFEQRRDGGVSAHSRARTHQVMAFTAAAIVAWTAGAVIVGLLGEQWVGAATPVGRVLQAYRGSARDGVLILAAFGLVVPACAALLPRRVAATIPPATAESLGATRLWIATILLASIVWEDLPSSAWLPRGMLDADRHWLMGVLHALPIGFDQFLGSPTALRLFETLTAVVLGMAAIGLFTRWSVPAGALLYMIATGILRAYSWTYHSGVIPLYALLLLSFTPCGDALSVDRWLRARRGATLEPVDQPRLRYGMGRFLVWMAIAIPYLLAGLSKLRNTGVMWWSGEYMKQMLVSTIVEPMHFDFQATFHLLRGPTWIFGALGIAALAGELSFVFVLVSRVARMILPAVTAGMHGGILIFQNILFPDLIAIQAVFYDWRPLLRRVRGGALRVRAAPASPEPSALAGSLSRFTRRQAAVAQAFIVVAFLAWATRTEKFPITAMQMFSRKPAVGPVEYVTPYALHADGSRTRARFEEWIGAMADTRYRRLLSRWAIAPESTGLLHEFLDVSARRANRILPPEQRIVAFELEHRRWDFRRAPADPTRGELVRRHRHVAPRYVTPRRRDMTRVRIVQ